MPCCVDPHPAIHVDTQVSAITIAINYKLMTLSIIPCYGSFYLLLLTRNRPACTDTLGDTAKSKRSIILAVSLEGLGHTLVQVSY